MTMLQFTRREDKQFPAQKSITELEHPSYYLHMPPNNFWLFPKIMTALKGPRFPDTEDIQKKKI
jgi:hypothetical protein